MLAGAFAFIACSPAPGGNDAGGSDAGNGRQFGAPCDAGSHCDSNICFVGGNQAFCSQRCDAGSDCPSPPTTGQCNVQGYCK